MTHMHIPIPTEYTKPELKMHQLISSLHVPFISQEPIHVPDRDIPYIVDFLIMKRIVVEVDGAHWHERGRQPMKDERRDEAMRKMNLVILRFADEIIYERPSECAKKIQAEIERLPIEVKNAALLPAGSQTRSERPNHLTIRDEQK